MTPLLLGDCRTAMQGPPGPLCSWRRGVVANRRMIERDISVNLKVAELSDNAALLFTWAIAHPLAEVRL